MESTVTRGPTLPSFVPLLLRLFKPSGRAPIPAETERNVQRYRVAFHSAFANLLAKGLSFILFAIGMRRASEVLDQESMGLWLAVSGLAAALSFLDLGMANAMTNRIAEARASQQPGRLARVISGGLGALVLLGALLAVVMLVTISWVDLSGVFRLHDSRAIHALPSTLRVFALVFALSLPANATIRVLVAMQEGRQAYLWNALANTVGISFIFLPGGVEPSIPWLLMVCYGLPSLSGLALVVPLYRERLLDFRSLFIHGRAELPALARPAFIYFFLQLGTVVAAGADGVLISTTLGVAQIASFAAAQKLFQLVQVPLSTINAPLWAAYADAVARGDRAFVRLTLQRSLVVTAALVALACLTIVMSGRELVSLWTHGRVEVPLGLLLALAAFTLIDGLGATFGVFLNGTGILRAQLMSLAPMLIIGIALKVWLLNHGGIVAMLLGYTMLYLTVTLCVYGVIHRDVLARQLR